MEMRRHSHAWSEADRWLLQAYWLLSGYGLRASRALGRLAASMLLAILLLPRFGLPQGSPKHEATAIGAARRRQGHLRDRRLAALAIRGRMRRCGTERPARSCVPPTSSSTADS
ncbi:hypothetical protein [Streptomyces antimycoticus]|uniref:hypothetical protein n=2 Tax=Streptomyces antimycoticus TaxID=68175 RepID=UPI003699FF9E